MRQKNSAILHIVLIALSLVFAFPLIWLVLTSLKPIAETMKVPIVWFPSQWQWGNYWKAFNYNSDKLGYIPFLVYGRNTLMLAVLTVSGTVISNSLVAYSFARLRWPGARLHFQPDTGDHDGSVSRFDGSYFQPGLSGCTGSALFGLCGFPPGSAARSTSFCYGSSSPPFRSSCRKRPRLTAVRNGQFFGR